MTDIGMDEAVFILQVSLGDCGRKLKWVTYAV